MGGGRREGGERGVDFTSMKIHSPGSEYHICSLYVFVIILVHQLFSLSVEKNKCSGKTASFIFM